MNPWSWLYLGSILFVLTLSFGLKNKDCGIISFILLVAFIGTRIITETVSSRFMFDMSNDLFAVVLLLFFVRHSLIARAVIFCYALITAFAYIPSTLGYMPIQVHHKLVDLLAFIQIFIILGGVVNGYRISRLPNRKTNRIQHLSNVSRSDTFNSDNKSKRDNKRFLAGDYSHLAKDG